MFVPNFMAIHSVVIERFQSKLQRSTSWWPYRNGQGISHEDSSFEHHSLCQIMSVPNFMVIHLIVVISVWTKVVDQLTNADIPCVDIFHLFLQITVTQNLWMCMCLLMTACYISINTFLMPGWNKESFHNNQHVLFTQFKHKTMSATE